MDQEIDDNLRSVVKWKKDRGRDRMMQEREGLVLIEQTLMKKEEGKG